MHESEDYEAPETYGEPVDVKGECNAHLYIGDNFGDNHATMRCSLSAKHDGQHVETYDQPNGGTITVTWTTDERDR